MKLLLDAKQSDRIVNQILDRYPHSSYVKLLNLGHTDNVVIW